jgi:hypothetical protein
VTELAPSLDEYSRCLREVIEKEDGAKKEEGIASAA